MKPRTRSIVLALAAVTALGADLTVEVKDFATMPMTGLVDGKGQNPGLLARVNFLREEPPGGKTRFFVSDLNGPLYILDKQTRKFTTYLDFNGREGRPGMFRKLPPEAGFGNGLISFVFDPAYPQNGKLYTIHLEDPKLPGASTPDNASFPGLKTAAYAVMPAIKTPGPTDREAVVIEWTDTNISNSSFEGTARELMRVQYNTRIHPMADLIFNPTARPGDAEWRVLYIASGDGGSGESRNLEMRPNPQRLDTLVGKVLRIIPDLNEHTATSTVSPNGRYRVPNDNPFVSKPAARPEIWAYGLRNPSRLTWDADPANAKSNQLIANVIGLNTWETVVFIHKGANYGYPLREGNQALELSNKTAELPQEDRIPVQLDGNTTEGLVAPTYPVIQYGHVSGGGDAISGGFVYRGKAIPALRGKYVFGDISTGNIWYADYQEMLAAEDGNAKTLAETHPIRIRWTKPAGGSEVYESLAPIAMAAYHGRGGKAAYLPGTAAVAKQGRAAIQLCVDSDGELFILSMSDGMIRSVGR